MDTVRSKQGGPLVVIGKYCITRTDIPDYKDKLFDHLYHDEINRLRLENEKLKSMLLGV